MDIYKTTELTEDIKQQLTNSYSTLVKGERLYAAVPGSLSHVEWAIGLMLTRLRELHTTDPIASLIEIGVDEKGVFISYALNTHHDIAISEMM